MPSQGDIASVVLGGSVALAGLLLVFSGFLFAQAAGFPPDTTDDAIIQRYRFAGRVGVGPFVLCLGTAGAAFCWMLDPSLAWLYWGAVAGFSGLVVVTAVYGAWTILRYL